MANRSKQAARKQVKLEKMFQVAYGSESGVAQKLSKDELRLRDQVFAALYANRKNVHV